MQISRRRQVVLGMCGARYLSYWVHGKKCADRASKWHPLRAHSKLAPMFPETGGYAGEETDFEFVDFAEDEIERLDFVAVGKTRTAKNAKDAKKRGKDEG